MTRLDRSWGNRPRSRSRQAAFRPAFELLESRTVLSTGPVIHEIQVSGANGEFDEYIEIYNPTAADIDLSDWQVVYRTDTGTTDLPLVTFPLGTTLAANAFFLLAGPSYFALSDFSYSTANTLAAAGGSVGLRNSQLTLIDGVGYGSAANAFVEAFAAPAPPSGQSIERNPVGTDTNNNALDFIVRTTPTPRSGIFNSAPVLDNFGNAALASIGQNETANSGTLVASIIASVLPRDMITDANGDPEGIAVTAVDNSNGLWEYSTDGSNWSPVPAVSDASALLLAADSATRLRFLPNPDFFGVVPTGVTFRAWDRTTGVNGGIANTTVNGGTTAFSTDTETASISVLHVNHAPVLNSTVEPTLTTIPRNALDPFGDPVATIIGSSITDADAADQLGIAVIALSGPGTWQYSIDNGVSWQNFGSVSATTARLLSGSDRVRFVPNAGFVGMAAIIYHGWDQTSGTAGTTANVTNNGSTTAFSTASGTASVKVAMSLTPINEDNRNSKGTKVLAFLSTDFVAANPGVKGIAVVGLTGTSNGTWQYSLDNGLTWKNFGAVSTSAARLLVNADKVRFLPKLNFNGDAGIIYHAWDKTKGKRGKIANLSLGMGPGTAFSADPDTSLQPVLPVNDRPVLTNVSPPAVPHGGTTVGALLAGVVTDVDFRALQGIAVIATTGTWELSLNGGSSWTPMGTVAAKTALLLGETDLIRFIPNPSAGLATLKFRAWDQTQGSAGTLANPTIGTAFSLGIKETGQAF